MPPRAKAPALPNQIDEISRALGRIDAYVHEFRHGTNNVSQKIDAMELNSAKRHDSLKLELTNQIDRAVQKLSDEIAAISARVSVLEAEHYRQAGVISAWKWIGQHWPFTVMSAGLVGFVAWATGKFHL